MRDLATYRAKRDFDKTAEPAGSGGGGGAAPRYSCQKHDATRLHWDLRLEHDGVLLSWAVTRGPSLEPADKRLAVRTEDHPLDYLEFEGTIPKGSYGAGTVMLWDIGWWEPFHDVDEGLESGHLHFALHGQRATGKWSLIRMKGKQAGDAKRENWLLIKEDDDAAGGPVLIDVHMTSVATGRTLPEIAADAAPKPMGPVRKTTGPKFHAPQLAELREAPPEGEEWWHEVKLDGYRAQVSLGKGGARIFTRNGLDWTDKFACLLPGLNALPAKSALIDGEIVAGAGLGRFGDVAEAIRHGGPFLFYGFDLLALDGAGLMADPLEDRRAKLDTLFAEVTPLGLLRLSPVLEGAPGDLFAQVGEAGGEGLVSKLRSAPYRTGRSAAWIKSKVERRGAFVIVGWEHSPSRGRAFASLLLASHENGELVYRGKVGTGFDAGREAEVRDRLAPLARTSAPLDKTPDLRAKITWVAPQVIAEVRFAEVTRDGHLRHASFIGLREDKEPAEVETASGEARPKVAGIGISSPERLVFPKPKITKLDVAQYYAEVAERLLQVAKDRPSSLVRLPDGLDGEQFFQKHRGKGFPAQLREVEVPDAKGKVQGKMVLTTKASLIAAVQMGTVEFHIEAVRIDKPLQPDRLIFDLDPDEAVKFPAVRGAVVLIRDLLAGVGLQSWPMVTGGKGVHIVAPLRRTANIESVALFSRVFATMLAERRPKDFTAKMAKADRKGRIFIDWMRNDAGSTAIAPFSMRARPGGPVATPVSWDELAKLRAASAFGMKEALARDWSGVGVPEAGSISDATVDGLDAAFSQL